MRQNLRACSEKNRIVAMNFSLARPSTQNGGRLLAQNGVTMSCKNQDTSAASILRKITDFDRKMTNCNFSSLTELCLRFF
jgi:hypothetical protein